MKFAKLDQATFGTVVASAPLVSMDLLVSNGLGKILLGLRANPPARGMWFVPGGRLHKGETLRQAFSRTTQAELGQAYDLDRARFRGVYEHFYAEDFRGEYGSGTHYVVLAYALEAEPAHPSLPPDQHASFAWFTRDELVGHPQVHPYTKRYFEVRGAGATPGNVG